MTKKQDGIVNIRGREYKTVALRVSEFREAKPDWSLCTEIVEQGDNRVTMKAWIADPEGRVLATGFAEEVRDANNINKTSALENCETSAIGRALAAFGLAGQEYASADEVARTMEQQRQNAQRPTPPTNNGDDKAASIGLMSKLFDCEPSDFKDPKNSEMIDQFFDTYEISRKPPKDPDEADAYWKKLRDTLTKHIANAE